MYYHEFVIWLTNALTVFCKIDCEQQAGIVSRNKTIGTCLTYDFRHVSEEESFLETQGQSVGSRIMVAKVFKNGEESPWDATLNKPVPRLIRMFVHDWFFLPNQRPASITLLSWSSYVKEFASKLDFWPYMLGLCRKALFIVFGESAFSEKRP